MVSLATRQSDFHLCPRLTILQPHINILHLIERVWSFHLNKLVNCFGFANNAVLNSFLSVLSTWVECAMCVTLNEFIVKSISGVEKWKRNSNWWQIFVFYFFDITIPLEWNYAIITVLAINEMWNKYNQRTAIILAIQRKRIWETGVFCSFVRICTAIEYRKKALMPQR